MKVKKIHFKNYLSILLIYFITVSGAFSQNAREIIIRRNLVINCPNPEYTLNRCDYGLLVPANRPGRQEVTEYKYSLKPDYVTKTEGNEYYIKWKNHSFSELKNHLEVSMKIKIKVYDLKTAKKQAIQDPEDIDTLLYLKDEENFRSSAKNIKEATAGIKGNDREEITKNIFNYVIDKLDYHIFFDQDRGAKKALKEGKGDCTEYSELMITLCRAKKIPARIVMGLIPKSNGIVGHHNWVEVFFPQYGWVTFDPTFADNKLATTSFYSLKNTYVQLSNKRFITNILCPCYYNAEFPFSLKLKDTCNELSNGIGKKYQKMLTYYKELQYLRADSLLDTLIIYEPDNFSYWMLKGMINARFGDFEKGSKNLQAAMDNTVSNYEKYVVVYAYARFYAIQKDGDKAISYLKEAVDLGFDSFSDIDKNADFVYIDAYPPFVELKKELKAKEEKDKQKLNKSK